MTRRLGVSGHAARVLEWLEAPDREAMAKEIAVQSDDLRRFNPFHWPAGSPGGIGGRFAPRGTGTSFGATGSYFDENRAQIQPAAYHPPAGQEAKTEKPRGLSHKGVDFMKSFEKLGLNLYRDEAWKWTIGYGHRVTAQDLSNGTYTKGITLGKADELFAEDTQTAISAVRRLVKVPLTQNEIDALVSFTYNEGASALKGSELLRLLNAGKYMEAAKQFSRWIYVTRHGEKVESQGLINRRKEEYNIFVSGIYIYHE